VAEDFRDMMRNVGDLDLFKGFEVGFEGLVISHLQYGDDTLCIGEALVDNLWTMKALLRGFEMVSGLRVDILSSG